MTNTCRIDIDPSRRFQVIDGFGVNINGRYWDGGKLSPVVDRLVDDLGATIFRLDIYGKSNWIDPDGSLGKDKALSRENLDRVYASRVMQNGLGMARHLNARGVQVYVTLSGIVPPWMCAGDGKTLADVDSYCHMATDFAKWLRSSGVAFTLFGPQNETDLGPPEGPVVDPKGFVQLTRMLAKQFDAAGLSDVRFVVAEQSGFNHSFLEPFNNASDLVGRVAALGMHMYADNEPVADIVGRWRAGPHQNTPVWMTEYGDLDQTGEQEYYFSRAILRRLFSMLRGGMSAALNWDAFDNYHDHDEAWTIYGLIRTGLRAFTPKKRYHFCRHVYRFVRPGALRIDTAVSRDDVDVLAFVNSDDSVTVVGVNDSSEPLRIVATGHEPFRPYWTRSADGYITTEELNCAHVAAEPYRPWSGDAYGYQLDVPPKGVFTIAAQSAAHHSGSVAGA